MIGNEAAVICISQDVERLDIFVICTVILFLSDYEVVCLPCGHRVTVRCCCPVRLCPTEHHDPVPKPGPDS